MARPYPTNMPDPYALGHLEKAVGWDRGEVGAYLRAYWPRVFPRIGVEAAYGFAVNGGPNENTADSATPARMSELGLLGVTGGRSDLAAPNTDRTESNDWLRYHASAEVVDLLGRVACMSADCWRPSRGGLADQIAVGIVSLARNGLSVMQRLPVELWPSDTGQWFMALASMGWSAGTGGAVGHLRPYFGQLAAAPEASRLYEFQRLVALASYAGPVGGSADSHSNPAYSTIRLLQKMRTALFLSVLWRARRDDCWRWASSVGAPDAQRWIDQALALRASGIDPRRRGLPEPDPAWWSAANYGTLASELYGG